MSKMGMLRLLSLVSLGVFFFSPLMAQERPSGRSRVMTIQPTEAPEELTAEKVLASWDEKFPEVSSELEPLVNIYPDLEYANVDGVSLKMDAYTPVNHKLSEEPSPRPVIVWTHGGGFVGGNRKTNLDKVFCMRLASFGYAVFSVEYRLATETSDYKAAQYPEPLNDVKTALAFIRKNATDWGIDPNRVFAAGASAGAWFAMMLGLSNEVNGVIDVYGPTDFTLPLPPKGAEWIGSFFGKTLLEAPELWKEGSPISHIPALISEPASDNSSVQKGKKATVPMLIIHGTSDRLVPFEQGVNMYFALSDVNPSQTFGLKLEGVDHGWMLKSSVDTATFGEIQKFLERFLLPK